MRYDLLNIVDLESTCWASREESAKNTSEIIEIGIVQLNLTSGKIVKSEGIIVQTHFSKVSEFCTELTTLTQEQVDAGVPYNEAYDKLIDDYDSLNIPWASYGEYDKNMFAKHSSAWSCPTPMSKIHLNIKALHALTSKAHRAVGMDRALKELGITMEGTHHRGIDDALNIAKIYKKITGLK